MVLESFVGSWILQAVKDNLDGRQYGGLKRRSTTHALIDMLHHWHDAVDSRSFRRLCKGIRPRRP